MVPRDPRVTLASKAHRDHRLSTVPRVTPALRVLTVPRVPLVLLVPTVPTVLMALMVPTDLMDSRVNGVQRVRGAWTPWWPDRLVTLELLDRSVSQVRLV